ncbi:MAG: glutathione S-transferase family protein [Dongiaceae bacterium]
MIELYTYATSNGQRASVMLEECGLPYKAIKIDLERVEQKTPNFLKINPSGQIPAIVDPGRPGAKPTVLAQSGAIILYLSEKTNKLLPRDPLKRALAQQWFLQAMSDVVPSSAILFLVGTIPEITTSTRKLFEQRLIGNLRNVDRRLSEAEFLAGEFSIADIALYPTVAFRRELIEQNGELRHLMRWILTMAARPAVQRGMNVPA